MAAILNMFRFAGALVGVAGIVRLILIARG